ncbi:MAG: ribonuclease HII, partial [Gammaproteobacteria bacterium]
MYESSNATLVAGVDEAGRGPLAGSVIAAAVILDPMSPITGLTDSKKLSARQRGLLEVLIKKNAACWALGEASCAEIDEINILQASLLAMKRAILGLNIKPERVLIDGNKTPQMSGYELTAIIKGDLTEPSISAAS